MKRTVEVACGLAAGAGLTYWLDPTTGKRGRPSRPRSTLRTAVDGSAVDDLVRRYSLRHPRA
jgi:hypothetical protein